MRQFATYTTLYKPEDTAVDTALSAYAALSGKVERSLYAAQCAGRLDANALKRSFITRFNITARQYNAVCITLQGKLASLKELNALYQDSTQGRIDTVSGTIERLRNEADMLVATGGRPEAIREARFKAHQKARYRHRQETKLARLKAEASGHLSLCFGSKRLFNAQHHLEANGYPDHQAWLADWQTARASQFCVIGSKDERMGNQSAQFTPEPDGTYSLTLRLPDAIGGGRISLNGLRFRYGDVAIRAACAENVRRLAAGKGETFKALQRTYTDLHGEPGTKNAILADYGQPITVRFTLHKYGWQVAVTVAEVPATTQTGYENGALGVDINQDHLAITVIDTSGNKVFATDIPCDTTSKDLSADQRSAIVGDAVKQVVNLARQYTVGIVHERLDFAHKKLALKETLPKGQRARLSAMAYSQILTFLTRRAWREGIITRPVNPAYTSQIGALKYQHRHLTSHQAAAQVIARRGLGFKSERIRLRVPQSAAQRVMNARPAAVSMPDGPFRRWQKVSKLIGRPVVSRLPQETEFVNLKVRENRLVAQDVAVRIHTQS